MIKGLQCILERFQSRSGFEFGNFFDNRRSIEHSVLNFLETKIFQNDLLEGRIVWQNNSYRSSTQRSVVAILATKPEFLVAKDEL